MNIPHRHNIAAGVSWTAAGVVPVELPPARGPEDPAWAHEAIAGPRTRIHAVLVCSCAEIRLIPLHRVLVWDPRLDTVAAAEE